MTRLAWHERVYSTVLFLTILGVTRTLLTIDRVGLPMPGFGVRLAERLARHGFPYVMRLHRQHTSLWPAGR